MTSIRLLFASLLLAPATGWSDRRVFVGAGAGVATFDDAFAIDQHRVTQWTSAVTASYVPPDVLDGHLGVRVELGRTYRMKNELETFYAGWRESLSVAYFLWRPFHSPFAEASLSHSTFSTNYYRADRSGLYATDDSHAWSPRVALGYQVTIDPGISIAIAAGVSRVWTTWIDQSDYQYETDAWSVGAELRAGFAF